MNGTLIFEHIQLILLFSSIALATNWFGASRGFFNLPKDKSIPIEISFKQVLIIFLIYIGIMIWLGRYIALMIHSLAPNLIAQSPIIAAGIFQFTLTLIAVALLFIFVRKQPKEVIFRIWKDRTRKNPSSIKMDLLIGSTTWFLSFPVVMALGQLCDLIIYLFFGVVNYEQVAVRYLKTTVGSPLMILLALILILVAAPAIEEFLFRGVLQNWLKKYMGVYPSIVGSALLFALFHLSSSQGLGNFSLIIPLFAFGCYLGFVYERQGSLFASIALHATFNAISSYRILLIPDQS